MASPRRPFADTTAVPTLDELVELARTIQRLAIERCGVEAKRSFAKIGVLMASSRRSSKPLHPTNLHVSQALFPNDTVQSRLPDPGWLERWLDQQIVFDDAWERRVVSMILHNLSSLFGQTFGSVQELNRYRKSLAAA